MSAKSRKRFPLAQRDRTVVVEMLMSNNNKQEVGDLIEALTEALDRGEELLTRASETEIRMVKILAELRETKETMVLTPDS